MEPRAVRQRPHAACAAPPPRRHKAPSHGLSSQSSLVQMSKPSSESLLPAQVPQPRPHARGTPNSGSPS